MNRQRDGDNTTGKDIEFKEGQRILSCCNGGISRCPSLNYEFISSSEKAVNKAFDLLFEEMIKIENITNYGT